MLGMAFASELELFELEDELESEDELEFESRPRPRTRARTDDPVVAAQGIARSEVPGMPGVSIQQLIERWNGKEGAKIRIPLPVLLAFIKIESGGHFNNATHAAGFYELGLFQTPAGRHGKCTGKGELWRPARTWRCDYDPPGREVQGDPSPWAILCKNIRANPQDWTNPTTQVRVGLLDLTTAADGIQKAYRDLFPTVGSDWYLRMAVLMRFAGGGGYTRKVLRSHRGQLAMLPEDLRWNFLQGKLNDRYRRNVNEKMALATKLGYRSSP
jgi:hypothetical protein